MSDERQRTLALRWGLVALGALSYIVLRASLACWPDYLAIRTRIRPLALAQRMSQLKPSLFKAAHLTVYLQLTLVLAGALMLGLLFVGVRDALRERD